MDRKPAAEPCRALAGDDSRTDTPISRHGLAREEGGVTSRETARRAIGGAQISLASCKPESFPPALLDRMRCRPWRSMRRYNVVRSTSAIRAAREMLLPACVTSQVR